MSFTHRPQDVPARNSQFDHKNYPVINISPAVAQVVCACLDGGEDSCISANGEISGDKIQCAVRKSWSERSKDVLATVAAFSPINMSKIINQLETRYSIRLPRETQDELLSSNTSNQQEMIHKICSAIESMDKEIVRSALIHTIVPGDEIIMNHHADDRYTYTKAGSKGVVISRDGDDVRVRFSYLPGYSGKDTYSVDINTLDLVPAKNTLKSAVVGNVKKILRSKKRNRTRGGEGENTSSTFSNEEHERILRIVTNLVTSSSEITEYRAKERLEEILTDSAMIVPHGMDNGSFALNRSMLLGVVEPSVKSAYDNRDLYSPSGSEVPPAERKPGTIAFEIAEGCDYGKCTFCDLYGKTQFKTKTSAEFKNHVDAVIEAIGPQATNRIRRVFIGGGNALSVEQKTLENAITHIQTKLYPERIALYGRTASILQKKEAGLKALSDAGLEMIYLGIESGSNNVLRLIGKGNTAEATVRAAKLAEAAEIDLSVMVILGLGGEAFSREHAIETAKLLNQIDAKYITFLTITTSEKSPYAIHMQEEMEAGTNRPLTNLGIVQQLRLLVENLDTKHQKIGMFGEETLSVGSNPIVFREDFDRLGKIHILNLCDEYIDQAGYLGVRR